MLTKLTPEQEAQIPIIRQKWLDIGLSTATADRPRAEEGIRLAYEAAGLKPPQIIWCSSPMSMCITSAILRDPKVASQVWSQVESQVASQVWSQVWSQVESQVESQVWSQVESQVESQVASQVESQVWSQVESQVESQVLSQVWSQVLSQVQSQVWSQVQSQVESQVESQVWSQVWSQVDDCLRGSHSASWLGLYDFLRVACHMQEQTEKLSGLMAIAQSAGWFLPCRNVCFVSERHNILHRNQTGALHCENGPALAYPDGWCIYALNGVRMDDWMVQTEPEKIDPTKVLSVSNAEQRRELIRRVGIERMLGAIPNKVLHKEGDYELLSVRLSDEITDARYLKMLNPSIGVWHVEGVDASEYGVEIDTVQKAKNWRGGDVRVEWTPCQLT